MPGFWDLMHVLAIVWIYNGLSYLIDRTRVALKARRRAKQGLCPAYSVEGWGRKIDWCGRQTPVHEIHIYGTDPLQVHKADSQLRDQDL
jgi:hypothetical protein